MPSTNINTSRLYLLATSSSPLPVCLSSLIAISCLRLLDDPKDAFWLAQVHFSSGNYTRAQSFLQKHNLIDHSPSCRYLAAHCLIKQSKFDEALSILGEKNPTHLISTTSKARRKLQHLNGNSRNGSTKSGKVRIERSEERENEDVSDIKFEAAMCYLRGICYAKQNAFDRAKECYKDAVHIDVQCFEAFDQLMKNSLMSPDEEWIFLDSLNFDSISVDDSSTSQQTAQFVKMLYTTRLSKYKNPAERNNATESLSTHYGLAKNSDLLLSKADLLFTQCRFKEALAITSSILDTDEYNFAIYPLHLACLHELDQTNTLFLVSHRLADLYPEEPASWLAVGIYYLNIDKISEARRYFSKASVIDPHSGPAWIGFAHTFAAEGEHDQAISAYTTAARLFQGTHLPQLFLGMQHLQLNNLSLAGEYLNTAHQLCQTDPLLLNELGVVFYHQDYLDPAVKLFTRALHIAHEIDSDPRAWVATRANLGHAHRRQSNFSLALQEFNEVLRQGSKDVQVFCAKGLVLLELDRPWEAVCVFHEALSVSTQDPVATDLLTRALEENSRISGWGGDSDAVDEEFSYLLQRKEQNAKEFRSVNLGNNASLERGGIEDDESMMVMSDAD